MNRNPFRGLRVRSARKTGTVVHRPATAYRRETPLLECGVCGAILPPAEARTCPSCGGVTCRGCLRRCCLWGEGGFVALLWAALFSGLLMLLTFMSADWQRMRLHRAEMQAAADAGALAAADGAWVVERLDARGRVWERRVVLDPVRARAAALDNFWSNEGLSKAGKLLRTVQADAWVDPDRPDEIVVSAAGNGPLLFGGLFGRGAQGVAVFARAKAAARP